MGGPELPQDPGQDMFPTPAIDHPRVGAESEESDDPDAYEGYQPLAMDEGIETPAIDEPLRAEAPPAQEPDDDIDLLNAEVTHGDPNMPPIEAADVEIERQVWSEPRPRELQIELDKTRTEQVSFPRRFPQKLAIKKCPSFMKILKAMASITLPNITVPDWAQGVPEERWKLELLERIGNRQRQDNPAAGTSEKPQHSKPKAD
ncbi:hypothetical protein KR018_000534 [Drosophila ironensis]|nr:hypothetical protein KR018_000534 [Drosophila ironensis]